MPLRQKRGGVVSHPDERFKHRRKCEEAFTVRTSAGKATRNHSRSSTKVSVREFSALLGPVNPDGKNSEWVRCCAICPTLDRLGACPPLGGGFIVKATRGLPSLLDRFWRDARLWGVKEQVRP